MELWEFFDEIVECELPEQLEVTLDAGDADEDDREEQALASRLVPFN